MKFHLPQRRQTVARPQIQLLERRLQFANVVWTGDVNANWNTNAGGNTNWLNDVLPADGDNLLFPAIAANFTNNNNLNGLDLGTFTVGGTGYVIGGNAVTASGIADTSAPGGANTINLAIGLSGATVTANVNQPGSQLTLGGAITGAAGLTKVGPGTLVFSGATANTYSGTTTVNNAVLEFAKTAGVNAVSGNLVIGDDVGIVKSAVARVINSNQIANSSNVTVNSDGDLFYNAGLTETFTQLTLNGGNMDQGSTDVTVLNGITATSSALANANIAGPGDLTIQAGIVVNDGPNDFDLVVSAGIAGSVGLNKLGAGVMRLQRAPVYTGATTVSNGTLGTSVDLGSAGATINATVASGGTIDFRQNQTLNSLTINGGGNAIVSASGNRVLRTTSLSIAGTGRLDLTNNAMIVDYTAASPIGTIQTLINNGFNGGAWTGNGIRSSTAASTPDRAVGFAEATDLFTSFPATFAGQSVDNSAVLARFTLDGDATLDRAVNITDFARLAANFNQSPRRWGQGNFNFDASTAIGDFAILASQFNTSIAAEPARGVGAVAIRAELFGNKTIALIDELAI